MWSLVVSQKQEVTSYMVCFFIYLHCEIHHKSSYNLRFGPGKVLEKSLVLIHQNLWEPWQTVELLVIQEALILMWGHCNNWFRCLWYVYIVLHCSNMLLLEGHIHNIGLILSMKIVWCNASIRGACWVHYMETLSALLALCAGKPRVTGRFPTQTGMPGHNQWILSTKGQ